MVKTLQWGVFFFLEFCEFRNYENGVLYWSKKEEPKMKETKMKNQLLIEKVKSLKIFKKREPFFYSKSEKQFSRIFLGFKVMAYSLVLKKGQI